MSRTVRVALSGFLCSCLVVPATYAIDPDALAQASAADDLGTLSTVDDDNPFAASAGENLGPSTPDKDEKRSEGSRSIKTTQGVVLEIVDESALRQRYLQIQKEHVALYSGDELRELISKTEAVVTERREALKKRESEFDQKLAGIEAQVEELRNTAMSLGAQSGFQLILEGLKQTADQSNDSGQPPLELRTGAPATGFDDFFDDFLEPQPGINPLPTF